LCSTQRIFYLKRVRLEAGSKKRKSLRHF